MGGKGYLSSTGLKWANGVLIFELFIYGIRGYVYIVSNDGGCKYEGLFSLAIWLFDMLR